MNFKVAQAMHAHAIHNTRVASSLDLDSKLGPGYWSHPTKLGSVKERIQLGDPDKLRRKTIYVACDGGIVVGSVSVASFLPSFWKASYWSDPKARALGVFDLVVPPERQKQGIGRFLMSSVEQLAREHGFEYVRLDAYSENPNSVSFYRAIGYENSIEISVRGCPIQLFERAL